METANKSQIERVTEVMNTILKDITTDDKTLCIEKCNVSQPTLWRYLNGKGTDPKKAIEILAFFKKQIQQREKAFEKAVA